MSRMKDDSIFGVHKRTVSNCYSTCSLKFLPKFLLRVSVSLLQKNKYPFAPTMTLWSTMLPRSLEDALKSLENVTLRFGYTSRPLAQIASGKHVRTRIFAITAYFIFMMRGIILATQPVSCPTNPTICLLLGDHVSALGYSARQMWHGLSIIYSAFCIYNIMVLKTGEAHFKLAFMTDFAPESHIRVAESLKRKELHFRLLVFIYHIGFYACVASCYGALVISLALESIRLQNLIGMLCSSFWMAYNMVWAPYTVALVHFLLYIWLSGEAVAARLKSAEDRVRRCIDEKVPTESTLLFVSCLKKLISAADQSNSYNETMSRFLQGVYFGFMLSSATALMVLFTGEIVNPFVFAIIATLSVTQVLFIFAIVHIATIPSRVSGDIIPLLFSALCRQQALPVRIRRHGLHMLKRMTNSKHPIGFTCGQHFPMSTRSIAVFTREVALYVTLLLTVVRQ